MKYPIALLLGILSLATTLVSADESSFSWQKPHAKVLPTGDLEWAPRPFEFVAGDTVRYIDFKDGDDSNPGTRTAPWKHHPWDANARGEAAQASGPITYVFKGGVIYRGTLETRESGEPGNPIRLTYDPSWGEGAPWIAGSQAIKGGWQRADTSGTPKGMPEPEKVWYIDLPDTVEPWCVWQREGTEVTRIHLARHPNWEISNPDFVMEEWLTFDGPSRHLPKKEGGAPIGSYTNWDEEFLKDPAKPKDFFDNARIWTMWSGGVFSAMGTPYDTKILSYDPETGTIERGRIGGAFYFGMGGKGDRYYVERHPALLDVGGEFYFLPKGEADTTNEEGFAAPSMEAGGRLFLRLPENRSPNETTIELGQKQMLVRLIDSRHIEISGLRFSFLNVPDNFNFPIYPLQFRLPTAIQLMGGCQQISIRNNDFYHTAKAVQAVTRLREVYPPAEGQYGAGDYQGYELMDDILVADNRITEADHGGISFEDGYSNLAFGEDGITELGEIKILRNRIHRVNFRPRPPSPGLHIPAIAVDSVTRAEIAGNIITRSWGVGIFTHGGRQWGMHEKPLIRGFVHHNKVVDSLLATNDWGAIENNTGGPVIIYNNLVANPVGPHPHEQGVLEEGLEENDNRRVNHFRSFSHNGYAYYLDGDSHKKYLFNNIAWGKANDPEQWFKNRSPQMMVRGGLNQWFNNTFFRFMCGPVGSSGARSTTLGNIYADIGRNYIALGMSDDVSTAYGGEDAQDTLRIGLPTLAFSGNVFQGVKEDSRDAFSLGVKGPGRVGVRTGNLDEFRNFLKENGAMAWTTGTVLSEPPLRDAPRDFRPSEAMPVGPIKFFVPFPLYRTVGEWDFSLNRGDPETLIGLNLYFSEEYLSPGQYYEVPWNNLKVPSTTEDAFINGVLENWTRSALQFDGQRYAVFSHEIMAADYPRSVGILSKEDGRMGIVRDPGPEPGEKARQGQKDRWAKANEKWQAATDKVYPGTKRKTVNMDTNNFLIEIVLQAEGSQTADLVSKTLNGTGYSLGLKEGKPILKLMAGGKPMTAYSEKTVSDGWHHLIAEVDRINGVARLYLDGKLDTEAEINLPSETSLANTGDFYVGKGPAGNFHGAVDFLRISRGTLADAHTSIDELYAWEFDGPFLADFAGNPRDFVEGAPGAIEW